jgi:hypothetical protein
LATGCRRPSFLLSALERLARIALGSRGQIWHHGSARLPWQSSEVVAMVSTTIERAARGGEWSHRLTDAILHPHRRGWRSSSRSLAEGTIRHLKGGPPWLCSSRSTMAHVGGGFSYGDD